MQTLRERPNLQAVSRRVSAGEDLSNLWLLSLEMQDLRQKHDVALSQENPSELEALLQKAPDLPPEISRSERDFWP
jgi:hypothetical protein